MFYNTKYKKEWLKPLFHPKNNQSTYNPIPPLHSANSKSCMI